MYGGIYVNKSDKFYLKQGRLELSMLDDENDDSSVVSGQNDQKGADEQFLFEHTKRRRQQRSSGIPKVKVNNDIYNTLHVMGQLLTKNEENSNNGLPIKKPVNTAKVQMIEQLANNVKVQDMTLPPMPSKEKRLQNVSITKADEIHETAVNISLGSSDKCSNMGSEEIASEERKWYKLEKEAELQDSVYDNRDEEVEDQTAKDENINQAQEEIDAIYDKALNELNDGEVFKQEAAINDEERCLEEEAEYDQIKAPIDERYSAEMEKTIQESYENITSHHLEGKQEIEAAKPGSLATNDVEEFQDLKSCQKQVDILVESFFDNRVPQYSFTKELKRHIEKHIKALKEQKTNFSN